MQDLEFGELLTRFFYGSMTIMVTAIAVIGRKLVDSVNDLNIKIAIVIEKTLNHEKELERHDRRLNSLERSGEN